MKTEIENDEMLPEYAFSSGIQGKHFRAYKQGTNVIFLDPDIAAVFKNSESVSIDYISALRLLLKLARQEVTEKLISMVGQKNPAL